ncbi:MAG: glucokinase [Arenimonas sp.]|jgi:glucokinase
MTPSLALLADIGGTNARFALADCRRRAPLLVESLRQFEVADFASLAHAARHYLDAVPMPGAQPEFAVFAIAGRIDGDEARITNHPWVISCSATKHALGLESLRLVNDFAAQAMAIELLTGDDLVVIGDAPWLPPSAVSGTYAVLGPGTGLGVSSLIVRDGRCIALETEGGHVSFAAGTPEEAEILQCLSRRFGRVSNERLISGGGLVNIHMALSELAGEAAPALQPQEITAGAARGDARCRRAIDVFCAVFGAIAGDLALTLGAWDGVFLTGGLVPKLLPDLQLPSFRQRFEAKGRFAAAMARVPTIAVVHPHAGLLGAAAFALQDATLRHVAVQVP